MTGGRTRPRYQLAIEALVSTTADPAQYAGLLPEHQRICHLTREIKSVIDTLLKMDYELRKVHNLKLAFDARQAGSSSAG